MRGLIASLLFAASPALADGPLPFDVGGAFNLTDQYGQTRTQADPDGHAQLLFFGYANCPGICTAALPLMIDTVEAMAAEGVTITPVMITVDPTRDTAENMTEVLSAYHPDFIGLRGDPTALEAAYKAFSIERTLAYEDPEFGPIYTHGSFVYLLDARGEVLTLLMPVMDAETALRITRKYIAPGS
ncbi:MAG: SCO family protein [Pseudomonadota bacterium]